MLKIRILPGQLNLASALFAACILFTFPAHADVLKMTDGHGEPAPEPQHEYLLPRRGTSKSQVEKEYGPPLTRHPAVGNPPISRWDYEGFSVFFEHEHVLHAVMPEKPKPVYNKDELLVGE